MSKVMLESKIVRIEGIQFTGGEDNIEEIQEFVGEEDLSVSFTLNVKIEVWNHLEDQWINCPLGHYILKGLMNEFYPCEEEALFMKYRIVDADV